MCWNIPEEYSSYTSQKFTYQRRNVPSVERDRDPRLEHAGLSPPYRQELTPSPARIHQRCGKQVKLLTRGADWHGLQAEGT